MGCERSNLIDNTFPMEQSPKEAIYTTQDSTHRSQYSVLKPISKPLTGKQILFISSCLEKHILFYRLEQGQRMKLIAAMEMFQVPKQSYIFRQEEEPNYAFILKEGTVKIELESAGKTTKLVIRNGSCFGDLALINQGKRSASAYAESDCLLLALSKTCFQQIMEELSRSSSSLALQFLEEIPVFRKLTLAQKKSLAHNMHEVKYEKDAYIFRVNEFANSIFLLKSGEVQITFPGLAGTRLKRGQTFGESCLRDQSHRKGTAKAISSSICFVISRARLLQCIESEDISNITDSCCIRWALKRSALLKNCTNLQIQSIIEAGVIRSYEHEEVVVFGGQDCLELIICLEGEILIENLFKTTYRQSEDIVEAGVPLNEDFEIPFKSPYTLSKKIKGRIFAVHHQKIKEIMSPKRNNSLLIISKLPSIQLEHLQLIRKLENLELGSRFLVQDRVSKDIYVICAFQRSVVGKQKRQEWLINEKRMQTKTSSLSVLKLLQTFKDNSCLYFLYENHTIFHLEELIKQLLFPQPQTVKFIALCLTVLIQYLHSQKILIRDLKPQNLYFSSRGYPKLFCLRNSKKIDSFHKTFTIIGSPHYQAPEVHGGQGYSFPCDLWSLGIILYQLALGTLPFADSQEDPYEIFHSIESQELSFPKDFSSKGLKDFIKLLLNKQSWNRPDHTNIRDCFFFEGVTEQSWKEIEQQTAESPPQIMQALQSFHSSEQPIRSTLIKESFLNVLYRDYLKPAPSVMNHSVRGSTWDSIF